MLEPIVVDHPNLWPHRCVQCNSATGPLVDTNVELVTGDRVYLCASCVRLDAIKLGLVKGKRNSELLQMARDDVLRQQELAAAQQSVNDLTAKLAAAEKHAADQAELLAWQQQRIDQLTAAIGDRAAALASLVES